MTLADSKNDLLDACLADVFGDAEDQIVRCARCGCPRDEHLCGGIGRCANVFAGAFDARCRCEGYVSEVPVPRTPKLELRESVVLRGYTLSKPIPAGTLVAIEPVPTPKPCGLGPRKELCVVHGHDMARVPDATECEDCGMRALRRRADLFEAGMRALRSALLVEHYEHGGGTPALRPIHDPSECKVCIALRGAEADLRDHGNRSRRPDRPDWEPR